jgi:hypothetical protein
VNGLANPAHFEGELQQCLQTYRQVEADLVELMECKPDLKPEARNDIARASGAAQLIDLVPNALQAMMHFAEKPSAELRDTIAAYKKATGPIFDLAAREIESPVTKQALDTLDRALHTLYHQIDATREKPVVGKHTAAITPRDESERSR